MTTLSLHYHPLSSYCHKVLIALEELGVEVEKHLLNLGDPAQRAAFLALWPTGKMPLLVDNGRVVPETSLIIEYLQQHHAREGSVLLPADTEAAMAVRLWDRLMDLYVMTPMQALTSDLLRPEADRDEINVRQARDRLLQAYAMIEAELKGRTWLATEHFSMADCAAAPALFYAVTYLPFEPGQTRLAAYFERLVARPSVAAVIEQAKPFFQYFPNRAHLASRFQAPAPG